MPIERVLLADNAIRMLLTQNIESVGIKSAKINALLLAIATGRKFMEGDYM